jgi:hypothetical protein
MAKKQRQRSVRAAEQENCAAGNAAPEPEREAGGGKTKRRFTKTYIGTLGSFYAGSVYELDAEKLAAFKNDTEEP